MTPASLSTGRRQVLRGAIAGTAALALPAWSQAGPYPSRPIELVVPWQAGGGADVVGRAFGAAVARHLPQPVVVVNRPGASGALGLGEVVNARADGYRIVLSSTELTFLNHLGLAKFSYRDLRPIARLNADPAAVVVRADAPYATLEQFLDAARKPDANIRVGNAGHGSTWHMAAAALSEKTGAPFNHIPYPGGAPAVLALLGGHIDAVTVSTAEVSGHIAAGKLKALAVMADQRVSDGFERVPTLKERGVDLSIGIWRGLSAPRETPDEVMAVLKAAVAKAVREPAWLDSLRKLHFSTDTYANDSVLADAMARESAFFKDLAGRLKLTS
ncbi:tripartite tricarboxylate transporter substrate binding protein [Pseudorhodoferax sp. LjRoot39]|uniref:Bug family tripartite tricarboxylate transporter substrate binding protein n=1 Tax=Pseudorhodoferax sp. LjRoot39 TaxID=3342328 RepID=UPI003ED1017A